MVRAALVSTLRGGPRSLTSFFRWHLGIGFDRIYAFFDDPEDPVIALATPFAKVKVIRTDESFGKFQRATARAPGLFEYVHYEVQARQRLNVDTAIQWAREEGIEWLFHVDGDELFVPHEGDLPTHLQSLETAHERYVTYRNREAIIDRFDMGDFFREATMFKPNPYERDPSGHAPPGWDRPGGYFLAYTNGKSAIRVDDSVTTKTPHEFHSSVPPSTRTDACVYHYPSCGFSHWSEKYEMLGAFGDKAYGLAPVTIGFHLRSRDAWMTGDHALRRAFFERFAVVDDRAYLDDQLGRGNIVRITRMHDWLERPI